MDILLKVLLAPLAIAALALSFALFLGEIYLVVIVVRAVKSAHRKTKQPDEEVPDA